MKKYLILYKETIRISIKTTSSYRVNFILQSLITLLSNIVFPLVTLLIYKAGAAFEGWSLYEVLLIQSIFTMSTGISNMLFTGIVYNTMDHVRAGTLEVHLIKPIDCLYYQLATAFNIESGGVVLGGGVIFFLALSHIPRPTGSMWLVFLILFLAGVLVMFSVNLLMASTSFKWVANSRIPEMYNSILQFGNYPQGIFPKVISALTAFVIPVAMIGYNPATALLGRINGWMLFSIIPCFLMVTLSVWLYRHMVKLYEGVGG